MPPHDARAYSKTPRMATGAKAQDGNEAIAVSVAARPVKGAYLSVEIAVAESRFNVQSVAMGRAVAELSLWPKRYEPALSATGGLVV